MLKRLSIAFVMGVGLATAGVGDAQAQDWWSFPEPPFSPWNWGSLDHCAVVAKVPSTTRHPAYMQCEAIVTRIEFCCANQGNPTEVRPGQAFTRSVFVVQDLIDNGDLLQKQKGKAKPCVQITNESLATLATPEFCVNPNWTPVACNPDQPDVMVIPTQFEGQCSTYACIGDDYPDTAVNEACDFVVDNDDDTLANDSTLQLCTMQAGWGIDKGELFPIEGVTGFDCRRCIGPVGNECSVTQPLP